MAFVALRADSYREVDWEKSFRFVAERITSYKRPREVRFVDAVPKTASGKILDGNCARHFRRVGRGTGDRNALVSWRYSCFFDSLLAIGAVCLGRLAWLWHQARPTCSSVS